MKKSKKLFLLIAALFFVVLIIVGIDISQRTTFPGSKSRFEETLSPDSADVKNSKNDSVRLK